MKKVIASALLLSFVFMGSAYAAPKPHNAAGHGGMMAEASAMGGASAMTEEQNQKFSSMLEEQRKVMLPLHKKIVEKKAELHLAKVSVKKDPARIVNLSKELGELKGQALVQKITFEEKLEKEGLAGFAPHHGMMRGGKQMGCMQGGMGMMQGGMSGHSMGNDMGSMQDSQTAGEDQE